MAEVPMKEAVKKPCKHSESIPVLNTLRHDAIVGWIVTVRCLHCGELGYTNIGPKPVWGDGA